MKQPVINTALILALSLIISCDNFNSITGSKDKDTIIGSHNMVTQNAGLSNFNSLNISQSFNVDVTKGESYSVVYTIDDNLIEYLDIYVSANELYIGLDSDYNYRDITIEAEITCPDITRLELSGASRADINDFSFTHDFTFELSGASNFSGDIECSNLYGEISGASMVELTGRGNNLNLEISGASILRFRNFWGNNASIEMSGASQVYLNVVGRINAYLSGASILYYYGTSTLGRLNLSGGSNVVHL